jgi:hypothetical protein
MTCSVKKTQVVNMHREQCDIRIDRGTEWGNPYLIGVDGTREEVIAKHFDLLLSSPDLPAGLKQIQGKRLGCHCKPKKCHGDNIAFLADILS